MAKNQYRRYLCALTETEKTLTLYLKNLAQQHTIPIFTAAQLNDNNSRGNTYKILVIDYDESPTLLKTMKMYNTPLTQIEIIVVNVPTRLRTEELIQLGNLKGLFYKNETKENICVGFMQIINGKNWLPREVMAQLLHYYHYHFENQDLQASVTLTNRELQILRCLQTRISNLQIADSLYISELTVKSHLYQIFKKISVKNRNQAIAWAEKNIVS